MTMQRDNARRTQAARCRSCPFARIEGAWLVLHLGEIEVWTRIDGLHGIPPMKLAALLERKFKLADPTKARPELALSLLRSLIIDRDACVITDEGHA